MNLLVSFNKKDPETCVVGVLILDALGEEKESGPYLYSRPRATIFHEQLLKKLINNKWNLLL